MNAKVKSAVKTTRRVHVGGISEFLERIRKECARIAYLNARYQIVCFGLCEYEKYGSDK